MTIEATTCPSCGERALARVVEPFTYTVCGREVTVPDVPRLRCSACAEELFDRESNRVIDAQRKKQRGRADIPVAPAATH